MALPAKLLKLLVKACSLFRRGADTMPDTRIKSRLKCTICCAARIPFSGPTNPSFMQRFMLI